MFEQIPNSKISYHNSHHSGNRPLTMKCLLILALSLCFEGFQKHVFDYSGHISLAINISSCYSRKSWKILGSSLVGAIKPKYFTLFLYGHANPRWSRPLQQFTSTLIYLQQPPSLLLVFSGLFPSETQILTGLLFFYNPNYFFSKG